MGAPKGNKYHLKLKEPDIRQRAYDKYCEWLAKGKSAQSFTFVEGDVMCCYKTIQSYIKQNPDEFPAIKKEIAYAQGYAVWEEVVEQSARGQNKDANTASLNMLMRNKFRWDNGEKEEEEFGESEKVRIIIADMKEARGDDDQA